MHEVLVLEVELKARRVPEEAVMAKDDDGTRRFVLVQIPEKASGQFDTLTDIGEERIRRAGEKVSKTRCAGWLPPACGGRRSPICLRSGITPVQAKEVVYQAVAYLGIGRVFPFLKATNDILEAEGVELPLPEQAHTVPTRESRMEGGEKAQLEIFGESMRDYKSKGNPDYPWINEWLVDNCFGDWYTRGGLDMKQREIVTFCYIAAQGGCDPQLRGHAGANLSVGNSKELMVRIVSSNLPFIGYPRTLNALAALEAVTPAEGK